jgi:hypothetical protein
VGQDTCYTFWGTRGLAGYRRATGSKSTEEATTLSTTLQIHLLDLNGLSCDGILDFAPDNDHRPGLTQWQDMTNSITTVGILSPRLLKTLALSNSSPNHCIGSKLQLQQARNVGSLPTILVLSVHFRSLHSRRVVTG